MNMTRVCASLGEDAQAFRCGDGYGSGLGNGTGGGNGFGFGDGFGGTGR